MRSKLISLAAALVLGAVSSVANAVSVYLMPTTQDVNVGDNFTVELWWDFTGEATLGGGTDVVWDPSAFSFVSLVFDDNPDFDPAFTHCDNEPCDSPGLIDSIATGNFDGIGGDGPLLVVTITFMALAEGSWMIDIAQDTNLAGPFVSAETFEPYDDITFTGATVNVVGAQIPLPAAAWLFLGGLGVLGFRRRRKA